MEFKVKIRRLFNDETSLKAICTVVLDDQYAVHGVKVIRTANGIFTVMPCEIFKDADGKNVYKDVFHPITSEARKAMEAAVLAAYDAAVAEESAKIIDSAEQA